MTQIARLICSMTKLVSLVVVMLVFVVLVPQANAGFKTPPTFDLTTSSNLAGATDAVYVLRAENPDQSDDAFGLVITIPTGYSIGPSFITNKAGMKVISAIGSCPGWSGQAAVATTTTPGQFTLSFGAMTLGKVIITAPTATAPGKMEMTFTGSYSLVNRGCYGDLTTAKGFFINPSTPGAYAWRPSMAQPTSGAAVEMLPRPGLTQTIEIVGPSVTTQAVTSTTESSTAPATTVLPRTTTQTTVQPATTTVVVEPETTTTTQPAPTGGGFPTETLAIVAVVLIVIIAGAVYALRRRK